MSRTALTPAGRRRLVARLADAEAAYQKVVASNPEANEAGDSSVWHDNFAYEENQRQMHQWARRVRDLRASLESLQLVEVPPAPVEGALGVALHVQDVDTALAARWVIAGHDDGDPAAGRVACNSPLGAALLGARVGDVRTVRVGAALRELEVLRIESAAEEA